MATTNHSPAIDSCVYALETHLRAVSEMTKNGLLELPKLIPILKQKPALSTAFVHARSYITKCHELADYICDEEQYTIKVIEEGNVEEFKDYLEEVLSKSKGCHKDLQTLLEFIEREERHINDVEEHRAAKNLKCKNIAIGVGAGTVTGLAGGGGFGLVTGIGVSILAGGICGAVIGGAVAMLINHYQKKQDEITEILQNMRLHIYHIEGRFVEVNTRFKSSTVDYLVGKQIQGSSRPNGTQVTHKVIPEARKIKDYCQQLKDAATLDDFIIILSQHYNYLEV